MRVVCRRLAPDETDHELVWVCVTSLSLALAASWFAVGLPWPHCVFLSLTGHPCITCGATRSAIAFFHADFVSACKWNPLVFTGLCALSIYNVYAFVVVAIRTRRLRVSGFSLRQKTFLRVLFGLALVLNWVYLLMRPAGTF